jgi:CBS domain-containing protein/ribosome-associated translation inhibitor RaiA
MKPERIRDARVADFMTKDVVWADPDDDIGRILGKMREADVHELPVGRKGKLLGLVTMRELMRRRNLPPESKVASVLVKAPELSPDTNLPEATELLISSGFRAVPVLDRKRVVGIISRTDLVRALAEMGALEGLAIKDFMTPNPQAVGQDETVDHAVKLMQALGERSVPVVDEHRHLKGVLGMKDIVQLFAKPKTRERVGELAGEENKVAIEVKSVMHYPPVTIGADGDLARAAELMIAQNVSSVIVTEKEEPVGIVTKLDLMHFLAGLREREELFVEISGLEDEPSETYDLIYDTIQKEMRHIAQIVQPRTLSLHVQKYKPEGDRSKYSLRCRFQTAHELYFAHHYDWDLHLALKELLENLYKRILREKDRRVSERKQAGST